MGMFDEKLGVGGQEEEDYDEEREDNLLQTLAGWSDCLPYSG